MSNFQIVVLSIFGVFLIGAVLVFSGFVPGFGGGGEVGGPVVLWGTIPSASLTQIVEDFNREHKPLNLVYVEKNPAALDRELTEALASGTGPDLIMLPDTLIYRHADKIYPIPYATLSQRDFKNTFVEEGELFLTGSGILALPFRLNPMVMYWNRDLFGNAGLALPPASWEEVLSETPKLSAKDQSGNLTRSAVSFGEYQNVNYAKDIMALLIMQAGNPITAAGSSGYTSVLNESAGFALKPADEAVRYFTNFSDPVQPVYSWNKAQSSSRDAFLAGSLALYFGYAGELLGLRNLNPHLNFDVTKVPQAKGAATAVTIGHIDGLAILKSAKNPAGAFQAAQLLTGPDLSLKIAQTIFLPPPRRDLLSQKPADAYMNVFFDSALMARGWIDPSPYESSAIFGEMVENVVSGRQRVSEAVSNASGELNRLFGGN